MKNKKVVNDKNLDGEIVNDKTQTRFSIIWLVLTC